MKRYIRASRQKYQSIYDLACDCLSKVYEGSDKDGSAADVDEISHEVLCEVVDYLVSNPNCRPDIAEGHRDDSEAIADEVRREVDTAVRDNFDDYDWYKYSY